MQYHLFGSLELPPPEEFLTDQRLKRLRHIQVDLDDFDRREPQAFVSVGEQALEDVVSDTIEPNDGKSAPSSTSTQKVPYGYSEATRTVLLASKRPRADDEPWDLESAFSRFAIREMATWGGERPLHELLRPAGLPSARIAQRTYYPSKNSLDLYREGCTIEDLSNPTMRLINGSGFNSENSLMFDEFCRREDRNGLGWYSPQSKKEHLGWSEELAQNMKCKVEIIYGLAGKERALARTKGRGISLLLWGPEYADVSLYLVYVAHIPNHREPVRCSNGEVLPSPLERIVVFAKHPKTFYHDWRPSTAMS